jgi:acetamidase/formamidase
MTEPMINQPTVHTLEPIRENMIGCFSRDHTPILTINSGDTVRYHTLDAGWGLEPFREDGSPRREFEPRNGSQDEGHCLIGPIAIRGAHPGSTLEVRIGAIRPGDFGFCLAGGWAHVVNQRFGLEDKKLAHRWTLDADAMTGRNQLGHMVSLHPFMGVMGMPPNESGEHSTIPPRFCGGNMDCKELTSGTILYLPIPVEGGMFYVGDGHAAQGDGEVSVTAIECPMAQVDLTFTVRDDMRLKYPRAKTPEGWITLGFHENLQDATFIALENMLDLLSEQFGVDQHNALALASVAVDMRITQIANGVLGAHAFLRDGAIR